MGDGHLMPFFVGDLATGLIRVRNIPARGGQAAAVLNGAGTITADVRLPLTDPYTGKSIALLDYALPGRAFLGYEEGGKIAECGPIWADTFDFDSGVHSMRAAGIRSYYDHRLVLPALVDANPADLPDAREVSHTASLGTIAKRLVQGAHAATGGSVPVVLPADVAGSATRNYAAIDLHRVSEKLAQITDVIGGPDIQFRPRFTTDGRSVEWVMLTGNPEVRGAGSHIIDLTAPVPTARGLKIERDATVLVTTDYEVGGALPGADVALVAKSHDATLIGQGFLRMESSGSRGSVGNRDTLADHAAEATFRGRFHRETWNLQVAKNATPGFADIEPGDYATIVTKANPRVGSGRFSVRIASVTTKPSDPFVALACFPERVRA